MASDAPELAGALPAWFNPSRHEDPPTPETPPAEPVAPPADPETPPAEPAADDDGDKPLGAAGTKALEAEKARRKTEADARRAAEKRAADAEAKVQAYEDEKRTELEKAQAREQRAAERATALEKRAVEAEIRARATEAGFADVTDAIDALSGKATEFAKDGDIDADAITTALSDLLDRKPHWRKPAAATSVPVVDGAQKPALRPDKAQGARGAAAPAAQDWDDPAKLREEAAKFGVRF